MDKIIRTNLDNLSSENQELQNEAFTFILTTTDSRVDWAYEAWNELVVNLKHKDNHVRAIAAQVLCNLAKERSRKKNAQRFSGLDRRNKR